MPETPKLTGQVEPTTSVEHRAWRTDQDDERVSPPAGESETGIKAFLRKLSMLFSIDPRSGSR